MYSIAHSHPIRKGKIVISTCLTVFYQPILCNMFQWGCPQCVTNLGSLGKSNGYRSTSRWRPLCVWNSMLNS